MFKNLDTGKIQETEFDFLHPVPKMYGRPYLSGSGLENEQNFIPVDNETLRHKKHPNFWSIGDASGVPTSKTFSAVLEQAEVKF